LPVNASRTPVVFGGTAGSTRVAGAATLDVTADMSIEAWAKPTVVDASSRTVVGKGAGDNASTRQYRLGMTATDGVPHWRASVYIGGQAYVVDSTTVPLPDTWYHLALVRRGGRLTLFVNGAVEGRNSYLPARSVLNVMLGEPRVGRMASENDPQLFEGTIDDVELYDGALTASEVRLHYKRAVKAAPERGPGIYWGAYLPGAPADWSQVTAFEDQVHKPMSIIHFGQAWWHDGAFQPFNTVDFDQVRAHGSIPMAHWNAWDWAVDPQFDQPRFALRKIINGRYDAYITSWAQAAKAWGHPFFLRFDDEMNGWWYPWSEQANGNAAGEFVTMWRHVHDIFTTVGATNVTWVWSPNVGEDGLTPLSDVYPGDNYVDWVAMDGYNFAAYHQDPWKSFTEVFKPTYDALQALAPSKPVMIAEVASSEAGGPLGAPASKAAWISEGLGEALAREMPGVKAVVWFNWDANNPGMAAPVESSAASVAAFAGAIGKQAYASNQFATLATSPIPPLR